MKTTIQSVKGTRDFYPEEMGVRSWLYEVIKEVSSQFGYQEYDGPFLEKIDLYAAKSGEELVKEQSFVFQDRSGEDITLRPELTPTLARMVAQRQNQLVFPLRWWSFGPFWRYERPQKGRTREFFQWNIDLIGEDSPEADAELVSVCIYFFQKVGLTPDQVTILVNDRKLMDSELTRLDITPDLKRAVFRLIDRKEKMPVQDWRQYGLDSGLSETQMQGIEALLVDQDLWKKSPDLTRLFEILEAMNLHQYLRFDPQIIRGLEYYTGIVFEAKDQGREGRSILGGGHYGNLVADVGGDPLAGVGFAMGDVMAGIVLEKYGCMPKFEISPAPVMVTVFDDALLPKSFALANSLRLQGLRAAVYPSAGKLQKQFKYADRMGIRYVVVMGPDEEEVGKATIKDLASREQFTVAQADLVLELKKLLANAGAV